jgi:hypothetical protein
MELEARFRIENIHNDFEKFVCAFCYLGALRANEACALGSGENGTVPLGPVKEDVSYDSFEGIEVLKILIRVLKRKRDKTIPLRVVALPLEDLYEPWSKLIAKRVESLGVNDPIIPIYRQKLNLILSKNGLYEEAFALEENQGLNVIDNPLRHLRIHDLFAYYKMDGKEVSTYTGHSLSSVEKVSSALDRYAHLKWTQYFPKLLKPLPEELRKVIV